MPESPIAVAASFERLERERRDRLALQRMAFNELGAAADPTRSLAAWERYCEATRQLEAAVAALEALIWQMRA